VNISKIDALCRKNNISRTILEERAGISNGALGKWEKSPYGPSITTLKKVADYCNRHRALPGHCKRV